MPFEHATPTEARIAKRLVAAAWRAVGWFP